MDFMADIGEENKDAKGVNFEEDDNEASAAAAPVANGHASSAAAGKKKAAKKEAPAAPVATVPPKKKKAAASSSSSPSAPDGSAEAWFTTIPCAEAAKQGVLIVDMSTRDPEVGADEEVAMDVTDASASDKKKGPQLPAPEKLTGDSVITMMQLLNALGINISLHGTPVQDMNSIVADFLRAPTKESLQRAVEVCTEGCVSNVAINMLTGIAFNISFMYPMMMELVAHTWWVRDNLKKIVDGMFRKEGGDALPSSAGEDIVRLTSFARATVRILMTFWETWGHLGKPAPQTASLGLMAALRNPELYDVESFPDQQKLTEYLQRGTLPLADLEAEITRATADVNDQGIIANLLRVLYFALQDNEAEIAVRASSILYSLGCGSIRKRRGQGEFSSWPEGVYVSTPTSARARKPYSVLHRDSLHDTPIGPMWLTLFRFVEECGMQKEHADAVMMAAHVSFGCYSLDAFAALICLLCNRAAFPKTTIRWARDQHVNTVMWGVRALFYNVLKHSTLTDVVATVPHATKEQCAYSGFYKHPKNPKVVEAYLRRIGVENVRHDDLWQKHDDLPLEPLVRACFPGLDERLFAIVLGGIKLRRENRNGSMRDIVKPGLEKLGLLDAFEEQMPTGQAATSAKAAGGAARSRSSSSSRSKATAAAAPAPRASPQLLQAYTQLHQALGRVIQLEKAAASGKRAPASAPAAKRARAPAKRSTPAKRAKKDEESEYSSSDDEDDAAVHATRHAADDDEDDDVSSDMDEDDDDDDDEDDEDED